MVTTKLIDYTHPVIDTVTHLSDRWSRETLCGLDKKHKPTTWVHNAWGTGCPDCATAAEARLAEVFARDVLMFERFVDGNGSA